MMHKIEVDAGRKNGIINKNIYGHFAEHLGRCIYGGLFVGKDSPIPNVNGMRTDVVEALKKIKAPVLRWPGGCFADEYHWEDGIGPQQNRARMVNTHWGYVVEDNSFGTHEFLELCEQIGCQAYITGNLGSGTVREMSEWVEYLNGDGDSTVVRRRRANGREAPFGVKYFSVGNENWGCGGNMRPEYYADEYRRYATYCRNYGENQLYKIACGPNDANYEWTDAFMSSAARYCDAISLHYYTMCGDSWQDKGSATQFSAADYYKTLARALKMDEYITKHLNIMSRYDTKHRVGLIVDEWGTWYDVQPGTNPGFLYQQNTMRDALAAALTFDIFNAHCDRVVMANIAQTVNVLQSVILTEGADMLLTPTYHAFDLYTAHHDAQAVEMFIECDKIGAQGFDIPRLSGTASVKNGELTITLSNTSESESAEIELMLTDFAVKSVTGRVLTGDMNAYNDFGDERTSVQTLDGIKIFVDKLRVTLPKCCIAEITCR